MARGDLKISTDRTRDLPAGMIIRDKDTLDSYRLEVDATTKRPWWARLLRLLGVKRKTVVGAVKEDRIRKRDT